jgi:hypothetical protein
MDDHGFPSNSSSHNNNQDDADDDDSGPDVDLASGPVRSHDDDLRQDDYQQVMLRTHPATTNISLLGFHELDLAHR